jgi:hypothetical protein
LRRFIDSSDEAGFEAGLADALLHPTVRTFRIDEVLELVHQAGMKILQFAQYGAMEDVSDEIERIRKLELGRESSGNFLFYLGHGDRNTCERSKDSFLVLNPCLRKAVSPFQLGTVHVAPRLGFENPLLGWRERSFLRSFRRPVALNSLDSETIAAVTMYKKALFLLQY